MSGWGARIRTWECRYQKPVPYQTWLRPNAFSITPWALLARERRRRTSNKTASCQPDRGQLAGKKCAKTADTNKWTVCSLTIKNAAPVAQGGVLISQRSPRSLLVRLFILGLLAGLLLRGADRLGSPVGPDAQYEYFPGFKLFFEA